MKRIILTTVLLAGMASIAFGHGGDLDSQGGHNNTKTGGYHYHDGKGTSTGRGGPSKRSETSTFGAVLGGLMFFWAYSTLIRISIPERKPKTRPTPIYEKPKEEPKNYPTYGYEYHRQMAAKRRYKFDYQEEDSK